MHRSLLLGISYDREIINRCPKNRSPVLFMYHHIHDLIHRPQSDCMKSRMMMMKMDMMRASYCVIILMSHIMWVDMIVLAEGGKIGINWGRQSSKRMIPSMVVDLLLQNGIKEVRLFNPAGNVLEAFSGTSKQITVSISLPNFFFFKVNTTEKALQWVDNWITTFNQRVSIRYVVLGNEPYSVSFKNKTYDNAVEILDVVQNALNTRGYGMDIKATTPQYTDLLNVHKNASVKPSEAEFLPEFREKMTEYLRILQKNNAPAMLNLLPFQYIRQNKLETNFAFMDHKSSYVVNDKNDLIYDNAFEFLYDSFLWAMNKIGFGDVKVVVSQIGWPTDALELATVPNAERFHKSFLPYIANNTGTPLRRQQSIDVFLHNLSDENKLNLDWGAFQRHWGIYEFNGEPKYKIDFTGKDRDILPTAAMGITSRPRRWCVFNGDMSDTKTVSEMMDECCELADCSSLDDGGSCSHLEYERKVSYAFNRLFQAGISQCNIKGFGQIVDIDPSDGICTFPVEILAAEDKQTQEEFLGEKSTSDNPEEYSSSTAAATSVRRRILRNVVLPWTIYIFLHHLFISIFVKVFLKI